jgi:hypothetical protein
MTKRRINITLWLVLITGLMACDNNGVQVDKKTADVARQMQCLEQQSSCYLDVANGRAEILFDVNRITAEDAFNISINYEGLSTIKTVTGYMEGVNMFMGKIPLFLEQTIEPKKTASSVVKTLEATKLTKMDRLQMFQGEMLVGSCSEKTMTWRVWLTFTTEGNQTETKMFTIVSHRS